MTQKKIPSVIFKVALSILVACYPLVVYLGLETLPLKAVAGGILVLFILRLFLVQSGGLAFLKRLGLPVALIGITLSAVSLFAETDEALLWYPVLVNIACLGVFSWTLFFPPSMIEHFARLADNALPDEAVPYTRKVTMIWCAFFVMNGSIAAVTAVMDDRSLWALYNGLVSYGLMGTLLGGEWLYRKWVLKV